MILEPKNLPPFSHTDDWLRIVREFLNALSRRKKTQYNRRVSIGDLLTERSDNAAMCGFGEGTTMYDNVLVLGEVKVGRHTWIGPGCILVNSGGWFGGRRLLLDFLGANSFINQDIPPGAKAFGSPARIHQEFRQRHGFIIPNLRLR